MIVKHPIVKLNPWEIQMAAMIGVHRQIEALRQNLPDTHGYEGDGWSQHIEGAAGELAVARFANRYWPGSVNTFGAEGDLSVSGQRVQVRTRSRQDYELIIRPEDKDDDLFVLVLGRIPVFTVAGWIRCRDGKRSEWLRSYGNRVSAYFVPQSRLQPILGGSWS